MIYMYALSRFALFGKVKIKVKAERCVIIVHNTYSVFDFRDKNTHLLVFAKYIYTFFA